MSATEHIDQDRLAVWLGKNYGESIKTIALGFLIVYSPAGHSHTRNLTFATRLVA